MPKGRYKKAPSPATSGKHHLYLNAKPPGELVGTVAKLRWKNTIHTLASENRKLPKSHEGILIGFCSSFQLLADCEASIRTDGLLVDGGRDGKRRSPALAGKIQALNAIRQFSAELGLSPASASRLPLPPIEEERNEFADL